MSAAADIGGLNLSGQSCHDHHPQSVRGQLQLTKLVERAAAGEEIVIAKAGKPVARLLPLAHAAAQPGVDEGQDLDR